MTRIVSASASGEVGALFVRSWKSTPASDGAPRGVLWLLHGLSSSSNTWTRLGQEMASQGWDVYAPDLSGHGRSYRSSAYSVEKWAEELETLNIPQPDLIIAHSLGAVVASLYAKEHQVKRLFLIDPVLRLPHDKVLRAGVRAVFAKISKDTLRELSRQELTEDSAQAAFGNLSRWDAKSVVALTAGVTYLREALASGVKCTTIRSPNSYIVPRKYVASSAKNAGSRLQVVSATTGRHDLHHHSFEELMDAFVAFADWAIPASARS